MPRPGEKQSQKKDVAILFTAFLLSRFLLPFFGIHFRYEALFNYWQYLDTTTLHNHLLQGIWYDHAQPPFFNLLLGIVLQLSGNHAPSAFAILLKLVSLTNGLLLYSALKRTVPHNYIPLLVSLLYMLSPSLMIFENELFYTTFISMLLLISAYFVTRLQDSALQQNPGRQWIDIAGTMLPLALLCLTRSMYHLVWLVTLGLIFLIRLRKTPAFRRMLVGSLCCILLVTSWYVKNYLIFRQFSTSSWIGMNMARTVFRGETIKDSSRIEAYVPFSNLQGYKPFISQNSRLKYGGLDDRDLLSPTKNDTIKNLHAVDYIEISQKYMVASKSFIKTHPSIYLKNVFLSGIIFFAPATRYPFSEPEAAKIKYYDLFYSFNLSELANSMAQRKIDLLLSAIPKMLTYLAVAYILLLQTFQLKTISLLNLFAAATIAYVFVASSFLEHYENMRFRYEIEPLFLLLLGQILWLLTERARIKKEAAL
jgi:hypothetical protein